MLTIGFVYAPEAANSPWKQYWLLWMWHSADNHKILRGGTDAEAWTKMLDWVAVADAVRQRPGEWRVATAELHEDLC